MTMTDYTYESNKGQKVWKCSEKEQNDRKMRDSITFISLSFLEVQGFPPLY